MKLSKALHIIYFHIFYTIRIRKVITLNKNLKMNIAILLIINLIQYFWDEILDTFKKTRLTHICEH